MSEFEQKVAALRAHHEELLSRKNEKIEWGNGIYDKYKNPVVTAEHVPLEWKYDFNEKDNPYLMQRIMCNEVAGEIYISGTRGGSRPKELLCSGRES
jgi:4-O-beta-D-mannosyl-D-glucose phosphorylase